MFTINRAFTPGMQRFPAVTWTGDMQVPRGAAMACCLLSWCILHLFLHDIIGMCVCPRGSTCVEVVVRVRCDLVNVSYGVIV